MGIKGLDVVDVGDDDAVDNVHAVFIVVKNPLHFSFAMRYKCKL